MTTLTRVCNLEDFQDPEILPLLRAAMPHEAAADPSWPAGHEHRKVWEIALAFEALRRALPRDGARVLGVGAGTEPTLYLLTTMAEVHATDLYADPGVWGATAAPGMLVDPGQCAPQGVDWRPERLVVQHMDARDLHYPDASFDGVFSSSSLEHMGTPQDIQQVMREIGRVLKPGGVASLSTEYRLDGAGDGFPGVVLFNDRTLQSLIVMPSGLDDEPVDTRVSDATRATAISMAQAIRDARRGAVRYPHIVLTHAGYTFTSVHLVLRKPKRSAS